ncbi:MAG: CotH kinase family protein [Marinilabiliales bacterium]|nr:CotH kinase family protein [Marinilabiliales bacterium]
MLSNADAYTYSTYFHKDRNGKLRAGPIWDLDLTYGNDLFMWYLDRSKTNVWQFQYGGNDGSRFWRDLFYNSQFRCYLSKRWNELILPGQPLNQASLEAFIDQTANIYFRSGGKGLPAMGQRREVIAQRISNIKSFIAARIAWMTTNLGSYSTCSNVIVPQLTITKIMYHPQTTTQFPDGDDLEFLEIRNTGSTCGKPQRHLFPGNRVRLPVPGKCNAGRRSVCDNSKQCHRIPVEIRIRTLWRIYKAALQQR